MTWLIDCIGKIEKGADVLFYGPKEVIKRVYYPELNKVETVARFKIIGVVAGVIGALALGVGCVAYLELLTLFAPLLFPLMALVGAVALIILGICVWACCYVAHLDEEGLKRPEITEFPPW